MGQGEQIALVGKVVHGEGELPPLRGPLLRRGLEVGEGVVHPPQVPLQVKAQAALLRRAGDPGVGGGVLGHQQGVGAALLQPPVHRPEELEPPLILPPGGLPVPVDEVAHRVHPQAVEVVLLQPEAGGGVEEAAHLPPGVHEAAAAPGAVSHVGAGVLVQGGAVVVPQAVVVHGEVGGDKVQQDGQPRLVALVHQIFQVVRGAVPGGGAEKAGDLIPPGGVAGVLGQGEELQGVVPHLPGVGNQLLRQLPVGVPAAVRLPPPGAQVELVDVQGALPPVFGAAPPALVPEGVGGLVPQNGGAVGAQLHIEAVGVAVVQAPAAPGVDAVLVQHARPGPGDGALPEVPVVDPLHGELLPAAELPDEGDLLRRRGEGAEHRPLSCQVSPQVFICVKGRAGIKGMELHGVPPMSKGEMDRFHHTRPAAGLASGDFLQTSVIRLFCRRVGRRRQKLWTCV